MADIEVNVPDEHMVVGYVMQAKVLDADGEMYFALRCVGVNDMEALGMAADMQRDFGDSIQKGKRITGESEY